MAFQPHLEYLGAVLGAWRHEEGEESSLDSLLQTTLAASCQQEAQQGADTGLAVWIEGRPKPELEDSSRVSAGSGGSVSVTQAALCVCLLWFYPRSIDSHVSANLGSLCRLGRG